MKHLFAPKNKLCQLFIAERLVLSEHEAANKMTPPAPKENSSSKAQVGGIEFSEAEIAANREALQEVEEMRLKEDFQPAIPDERINISEQREAYRRFEEEKAKQPPQNREGQLEQLRPLYSNVAAARGDTTEPHVHQQDQVWGQDQLLRAPELRKVHSVRPPRRHYEYVEPRFSCGNLEGAAKTPKHHDQQAHQPGQTSPYDEQEYDHPELHIQLKIGSTVQLSLSDPPRYGVIRWIGELPRVEGLIAGMELVSNNYYPWVSGMACHVFLCSTGRAHLWRL